MQNPPGPVSGPAPLRRRGRPGLDLDAVLSGSVMLFNERGFDGTSMEDLARRLGISKSAIYHHVTSKDALLGLALDHALSGLEELARQVRGLDVAAVQRLERLVHGSVEVLVQRLPYVTLLLRVHGNTAVERAALVRRRRLDRFAAGLVRQAVAQGDLRTDLDPITTARVLFGTVNSLTEWLKPSSRLSGGELADLVTSIAFDGLRHR